MYCTLLYFPLLDCIVLHFVVLSLTGLHCIALCCTFLNWTALYCTLLYFPLLNCIVLHFVVLSLTKLSSILYFFKPFQFLMHFYDFLKRLCDLFLFLSKGMFAKNKRGYGLPAKLTRFWSLLILLLSVASRRKLLKTTYTEDRSVHKNSLSCNIRLGS